MGPRGRDTQIAPGVGRGPCFLGLGVAHWPQEGLRWPFHVCPEYTGGCQLGGWSWGGGVSQVWSQVAGT